MQRVTERQIERGGVSKKKHFLIFTGTQCSKIRDADRYRDRDGKDKAS